MPLSSAQRSLLIGQALGGFGFNLVLNGALAWFLFPPVATIPLWARGNCIAGDTIGTSFFLPLITCLVLTSVVRRALRANPTLGLPRTELPRPVRSLPGNMLGRGAVLGLLCALSLALLTLAVLAALGISEMTRGEDTLYKALYTAGLGALVTPLFGWRALADGR
jgi:hypothetical protein